jgi:hypothetical protein
MAPDTNSHGYNGYIGQGFPLQGRRAHPPTGKEEPINSKMGCLIQDYFSSFTPFRHQKHKKRVSTEGLNRTCVNVKRKIVLQIIFVQNAA